MSASRIRSAHRDAGDPRPLGEGGHDALDDFPSEHDAAPAVSTALVHRPSGVTMRVARISPGVAVRLALVLLLGAGSAALISLLAAGGTAASTPASLASVHR
jgi:hypothetical protein